MNSSTFIRHYKRTTRAVFYDLYLKDEDGSEYSSFSTKYAKHPYYTRIAALKNHLELIPRVPDSLADLQDAFDRTENFDDSRTVALPGKGINYGIIKGRLADLRLFCFKPNDKTLIYLNGYGKRGLLGTDAWFEGMWQNHPEFGVRGKRLLTVLTGIDRALDFGALEYHQNGGYVDSRTGMLIKKDFDLTEYLI